MSLARAFAYAGVPSMLMSLWAVPDDATTALMIEFYRELKKKQRKDEALRNSKLTYLANTKDPLFSHPYFWGGFVLIGDAQALSLPSSNKTILWWLAPVIFVGSISYFIFRKR